MFVSDCLGLNALGHLTIGGRDTVELAQTYGTPLYVMDEDEIRRACESYRESINRYYGGRGLVTYASKAFCCKAVCRIVAEEGLGLDVVSGRALHRQKRRLPARAHLFPRQQQDGAGADRGARIRGGHDRRRQF